ncbi:MAG: hypothetical protein ABIV39_12270 [Verrucomicrobiota bacterium]
MKLSRPAFTVAGMKRFLTLVGILSAASLLAQTNTPIPATTVNGSVFVVMKNGSNVKLALAPVHVMSEPRFL